MMIRPAHGHVTFEAEGPWGKLGKTLQVLSLLPMIDQINHKSGVLS